MSWLVLRYVLLYQNLTRDQEGDKNFVTCMIWCLQSPCFKILLYWVLGNFHSSLKSAYILIYFKVLVFDFRCRGSAINYLVSIYSHRSCLDACNRDDRCDRYSYFGSDVTHPDQDTCYLFSSSQCDMEDLMFDDGDTLWRTGNMTLQTGNVCDDIT